MVERFIRQGAFALSVECLTPKVVSMIVIVDNDPEFVAIMVYCLREVRCAVTGFVVSATGPIEPIAQKMAKLNPRLILVPETNERQGFRVLASFRLGSSMGGVNLAPILRHHFESIRGN